MRDPSEYTAEELQEIKRLSSFGQHEFEATPDDYRCAHCGGGRFASVHLVKRVGTPNYAW